METLQKFWDWRHEITLISDNFFLILGSISIALLIASLSGCIWAITLLPVNYFARPKLQKKTLAGTLGRIGKNIVGIFVFIAGILMLVLPGPGLLTMFLGTIFIDFPRKDVIIKKIISQPHIFKSLNRIRIKFRKDPFIHPNPN